MVHHQIESALLRGAAKTTNELARAKGLQRRKFQIAEAQYKALLRKRLKPNAGDIIVHRNCSDKTT